ncbi:MAG TPA: acyltransferase family protein [Acidimicrobiia bacterium]|nr:acyltransferase family protein [Acidimicrobiia bacterium]
MASQGVRARSRAGTRGPHLGYLPGLDGLRAIAVIAVLLYHAELTWIPGGFLGVEVFFVISGYLITALLLAEHRYTHHVDVRAFWLRRARRLLPALFALLLVVTTYAVLFLRDEVAGLRGDVLGALTYVTNWYLVFSDQSYFEAVGRPSPLLHLWSLAVEEQFYLLWPLLFAFGMRKLGRTNMLRAVAGTALLSSAAMWVMYRPEADPSRIYYGTDTRASGLLLGAALAFVWTPTRLKSDISRGATWVLDGVGLVALLLIVRMFLEMNEFDSTLYRGGFLTLDVLTVVLIGVTVHPAARLGKLWLSARSLQWVGLRSYSIYLWHWPVYVVTRPDVDVPLSGLPLLALRLALTAVLASVSYKYVEQPIRHGALSQGWHQFRIAHGAMRRRLALQWSGGAMAVVLLVGGVGLAVAHADEPPPPEFLATSDDDGDATVVTFSPTTAPATPTTAPGPTQPGQTAAPTTTPPATNAPAAPKPPPVTAIGDSVMLGAAETLWFKFDTNVHVNAAVGRSVGDALNLLRTYRDEKLLSPTMVIHIGNNGTFTDSQFDELMEIVGGNRKVIVLNTRVPRRWEAPNNEVIFRGARKYSNAYFLDWKLNAEQIAHNGFYDDGMHLRPFGAAFYAELIKQKVAG